MAMTCLREEELSNCWRLCPCSCLLGRAAASTLVVEYYSSSKLSTIHYPSTRYFLFAVANFQFRLPFLQSVDELLKSLETRGFAISFATCQPRNRSEYWACTCRRGCYAASSETKG